MEFFKILKEIWKEDKHFRISMTLSLTSLLVSIIALISRIGLLK